MVVELFSGAATGPRDDDGRVVRVAFTTAGHDLADVIAAEVADALAPMIDRLSPAERKRLNALTGKMFQ